MFQKSLLLLVSSILLFTMSCASTSLTFNEPGLFPEGVAALPDGSGFLVGSLTKGTVGKVDWQGKYSTFIEDKNLISSLGIKVDPKRDWVLVANGDPGASNKRNPATPPRKTAGLGIYKLSDGSSVQYFDFSAVANDGAAHIANDIAIAPNGDIYITDSFSPMIFKVDSELNASVFAKNPGLWSGKGFVLNSIVYTKEEEEDYLLVARSDNGELFRISIQDPSKIVKVSLPEAIIGADGAVLVENKLYVVAQKKIYVLSSSDQWQSAAQLELKDISESARPTTITEIRGTVYYIDAKINLMSSKETIDTFTIYKY